MPGAALMTPPGEDRFDVDVSQEDLAAMANVSRATATSIIAPLSKDGLIALSYRKIEVLKPDRLRALLA